jgi:pilus assembly protein CpaB
MTPALRRLLALVVAIALALVGALSVVSYANRADERAIAEQRPTEVLIVTQEVPRGTPSEALAGSVRSALVPATAVARDAVTDLEALAGLVAAVDLVPASSCSLALRDRGGAGRAGGDAGALTACRRSASCCRWSGSSVVGSQRATSSASSRPSTASATSDASDDTDTATALLIERLLVTFVQYSDAQAAAAEGGVPLVPAGELLLTFAVDTVDRRAAHVRLRPGARASDAPHTRH